MLGLIVAPGRGEVGISSGLTVNPQGGAPPPPVRPPTPWALGGEAPPLRRGARGEPPEVPPPEFARLSPRPRSIKAILEYITLQGSSFAPYKHTVRLCYAPAAHFRVWKSMRGPDESSDGDGDGMRPPTLTSGVTHPYLGGEAPRWGWVRTGDDPTPRA